MQPKWKTFEELVRGLAELIYGQPCAPGRIAGVNFDGVIERGPLETVVIEITRQFDLDKVRQGVTRLTLARQTLSAEGVLLRGHVVLPKAPTPAMVEAATTAKLSIGSAGQFASLFFQFPIYKNARAAFSFGSSIDPITGAIDVIGYVPVTYVELNSNKELTIGDLSAQLLAGRNVVLLGEYGTGKSRCVREIFTDLAERWDDTFQFPFAVNLRECWGLERGDEIIRRAMYVLGLDAHAGAAVRAFNRNSLILLLDGFDELGSQSWSTDESRLRFLRARALAGVKDLVSKTKAGCLIAGREHYFSSNAELITALGVNKGNTLIVKAKAEFTIEELDTYFDIAGLAVELPSWLPKRPLICQTIALLSDEELGSMFGIETEGVEFWNHFMKVLCQRDARINAFFDADTIYLVFVALSRITRVRSANIGPISQRDLQDAFEGVVGQLPVEEASAMLQRLPSLGRIGAESQDRQFVDMFILDGLRAKDVAGLREKDELYRAGVYNERWVNPLGVLGQSILAEDIKGHVDRFKIIASRSSGAQNQILAGDIVSAFSRTECPGVDLQGLTIDNSAFAEFTLNETPLSNLTISNSIFEQIVLPNSPPNNVQITHSSAGSVSGVASFSGLPAWVQLDSVDHFDTVQTVAQIRRVGLSPAHEILVAILKKTFKQKGAGRKEEALLRGFGAGASKKLASAIINYLLQEDFLSRHKGDEGWIYSPSRSKAGRVSEILNELRSSSDSIWATVGTFSK